MQTLWKKIAVYILSIVLLATIIQPAFVAMALPADISLMKIGSAEAVSAKTMLESALKDIEELGLPNPDEQPDYDNKLEFAMMEISQAVDGNFESDNMVVSDEVFERCISAAKRLDYYMSYPGATEEYKVKVQSIINTLISATRLIVEVLYNKITDEIINISDPEFDTKFSYKNYKDALKYYNKALSFEDKNNLEEAVHFYNKAWTCLKECLSDALSYRDKDDDGCPDILEEKFGLAKNKADTDGDGLSDGFEVLKLYCFTDGAQTDTNADGIADSLEDADKDGLNNLDEQTYGTSPLLPDTDKDGLTDQFELLTFNTIPTKYDSDEDGLSDGSEYRLNTDPNNSDTDEDGIIDSLEVYTQAVSLEGSTAKVELQAVGDITQSVTISELPEDSFVRDMSCVVSEPIDIEVTGAFNSAKVYLPVSADAVPNGDYQNVSMLYFDETLMTFVPLDIQGYDAETGMVWAETTHFTTFVLFYIPNWSTLWAAPLNKGERTVSTETTYIDLAFVLDSSGSMSWNDPSGFRKTSAKSFVDALLVGDRAAVVDFDSYARLIKPLTTDFAGVKTAINSIDSNGGTNIGVGVSTAINELISKSSEDRIKVIILLTDGEGSYSTALTQTAANNDIIIYTIGLGTSVDSVLLRSIATGTGGQYFPVSSASQLPDVFSRITEIVTDPVDTDGDGLYDSAETAGMRNGFGELLFSDPTKADSDDDGLPDGEEVGLIATSYAGEYYTSVSNPMVTDSDNDFLTDAEELDLGTKVYSSDSDNDKLKDFVEYDIGYDPLNANPDGDTYNDYKELIYRLDPFVYDEAWYDYVLSLLAGAVCGDFGKTLVDWGWMSDLTFNSIAYVSGQILSGFVVIGDIRDFVATVSQGDVVGSLFNVLGVIPLAGDVEKVAVNLIDFGRRSVDNIPKVALYISRELGDAPVVRKAVYGLVGGMLCKGDDVALMLKAAGNIGDDTIGVLAKRSNDMKLLANLTQGGLKFSDDILSAAQKTTIKSRIVEFWGEGLSNKRYAEALAVESAIVKYEDEGYALLYAQRPLLHNGVKGPDIIMKNSATGETLIVEAKGSYALGAEMSDGMKPGNRLYSKVNGQNTLYLSKDWLNENAGPRYLNILKTNYPEAANKITDILNNGGSYKASVVYVGSGVDVYWGRNISNYTNDILKEASSLDMIRMKF